MERRFVIKEGYDDGLTVGQSITETELKKRMNKALHTATVSNVTELITNEDEVIDILLHGEEEDQTEPEYTPEQIKTIWDRYNGLVEKGLINPPKPTRQEWEEWIDKMPMWIPRTPAWSSEQMKAWFLIMTAH